MVLAAFALVAAPFVVELTRHRPLAIGKPAGLSMLLGLLLAAAAWLRVTSYRPRPAVVVSAAVVAALALSAASWRCVAPVTPDSCNYMAGASAILHGRPYLNIKDELQLTFPPGYPALVAAALAVVGDEELGGRLVSALASAATIPVLYLLLLRLAGASTSAAACLLVALVPLRVHLSTMVWSESAYLFFLLLGLLAMCQWLERGGYWRAALTGAALGGAYLIRPEAALVLGIAVACAYGYRRGALRRSAQPILLVGAFAVVALPYVLFMHNHTGRWQLTGKSSTNLATAEARSQNLPVHGLYRLDEDTGRVEIARQPALPTLPGRAIRNAYGIMARLPALVSPLLFAFAGLGLGLMWVRQRGSPAAAAVLLTLASPLLFLPVFFWEDRMLLAPVVLGVALGMIGVAGVADILAGDGRKRLKWWLVIGAAGLLVGQAAQDGVIARPAREREYVKIAHWIEEHFPRRSVMVSRLAVVSYYADKTHRPLPWAPLDGVVRYARDQHAELMLLPRRGHEPSIVRYASEPHDSQDLELVKLWDDLALFRLRQTPATSEGARPPPDGR